LSQEQHNELEKGYRNGKSHAFRRRCQMVLLKSENRSSLEVARIMSCCEVVVNSWQKRFEAEGIDGLVTRPGRGRPPILSQQNPEHIRKVREQIKQHPNSVKTVVAHLEQDLDLVMHPETLKRFLKKGYRFCRARTWLKSRQVAAEGRWLRKAGGCGRQVAAERVVKEALLNILWKFYRCGSIAVDRWICILAMKVRFR
jgi:transposase